jgi:ElaB/YqjD/DUF883 family membrane-anchored ribosome-binding protein
MLSPATKAAANVTKNLAENDIRNAADDATSDGANLADKGKDILNNVSDYASEAGQKVRGFFDQTLNTTGSVTRNVEAEIKNNPVRSAAIALGAGFILGALLTRR